MHLLISHDINTLSGDYLYTKRIIEGLRKKGYKIFIHNLPGDFPFPGKNSVDQCEIIFNSIPETEKILIEGSILSVIADLLKKNKPTRDITGIVHLPVSLRTDLSILQREMIILSEKTALQSVGKFITSSNYTKNILERWGIDQSYIYTVIPGVDNFPVKTDYAKLPIKLLTVANYVRNKGFSHLIKALSALNNKDWVLNCYGNKEFDREYYTEIKLLISRNKLDNRIKLNGPLSREELSKIFLSADLFILPSDFEIHGMAITEALMHGLPVVASTGGAINEIVPTDMAKFFNPSDIYFLQSILEELFENEELYAKLCKNASTYHLRAQSWETSIDQFEKAILTK